MCICWDLGRCTVRDVLEEDLKTHRRDYRTVLTFLGRMAKKGWLAVEREGNTNFYIPRVRKDRALTAEIERFLEEVVGPESEDRRLLAEVLARR